jgi:hypothetical protein
VTTSPGGQPDQQREQTFYDAIGGFPTIASAHCSPFWFEKQNGDPMRPGRFLRRARCPKETATLSCIVFGVIDCPSLTAISGLLFMELLSQVRSNYTG